LIGVADAGDIVGTEADQFQNNDKYLLHLNNRIREHIGFEYVSFINFQLVPIEGKTVSAHSVPAFTLTGISEHRQG
jgi:hypothetical protein